MSQSGTLVPAGILTLPIPVPSGGTGATSFTPYAVITGGVTSTSPLQSIASVGLAGQLLTSNGAGALPTFQNAPAGGVTSVSGTANRITSTGGATPVIDISASYVGQSSITTLGTITTGVWNGTTIAVANGGTGAVTLATNGVLVGQGTSPISAVTAPTIIGSSLGWNATNVFWQNAKNTMYFYDDFFGNLNNGFWNVSGTGAVSPNNSSFPAIAGHPGVWALQDNASATGTASITLGNNTSGSMFLGSGAISITWIAKLSALSDVSDTYSSRMGFSDSFTGTAPPNGCYFTYTHGTNGGRWQIVTVAATVATTSDSGIAADTNYHSFRIDINAGATSVAFYIDDVQTSNSPSVTNIPVAILYPQANFLKTVGTTRRALIVDAFTLVQNLTTPR